jgi:flagellar biogenesis protein FliO
MENTPILASEQIRRLTLTTIWSRIRAALAGVKVQRRERRLRLCESVSLGEKRIVAIVQVDDQRFLIAATSQNISLLQLLGPAPAEKESTASNL